MGDVTGFLKFGRELPARRPVPVRLRDWKEVYEPFAAEAAQHQGARCMDCGIPFCHEGCPLGNLIPEWNDLVYRDDWSEAVERLHATNNFPEFTGRLCPAPVRGGVRARHQRRPGDHRAHRVRDHRAGLVRGLGGAGAPGRRRPASGWPWSAPGRPGWPPPSSCAGPATHVVVYERAERPGGLLRYGIPEFKMEKAVLDRRLEQLEAEGVEFRCGVSVGSPSPEVPRAVAEGATSCPTADLVAGYDAVVLAGGATLPRDLPVPGRHLDGIHRAMDYLKPSNMVREGLARRRLRCQCRGQARGHHRRRGHRSRLPGHRPPPGGPQRPPARDHAASPRPAGPGTIRGRPGR